jgi:hypothetical protein
MLDDKPSGGSQASESLYTWWLNSIPSFFGAASPKGPDGAAAAAPSDGKAGLPVDQIAQALEIARQLLTPLYQASLQALLAHPQPEHAFGAVLEQARARLHEFSESLAGFWQLVPPQGMQWLGGNFMMDPLSAFGGATRSLSLNLERTYGGLADAFGLAPSRELQQAARELMTSAVAKRRAQAEYLAIVVTALAKGIDGTVARLRDMGQRGETVDSLRGLLRVWARSTDEAMHVAMQTPAALDASGRLLRASTRSRQQLQRVVAVASTALNVPTRAEIDDAYREIQELKRELRRLRKASPQADAVPGVEGARTVATKKAGRARAPVARTSKSRKTTA